MRYVDLGSIKTTGAKPAPKKSKKIFMLLFLAFFGILLLIVVKREGLSALLNPVSIVSSIVGDSLKETDGRTNFLILGLDRRASESEGGLTDTILVLSYSQSTKNTVMISLPRDLLTTKDNVKLNEIYSDYGWENISGDWKFNSEKGTKATIGTIEDVLGIPIHYYAIVDFKIFEKVIDTLGGIDVNVETTFDDYDYPVEGKEDAIPESDRYMHVHFDAGLQRMDSKTALIFSRSRKGNNGEGTDFARAKRQQKVILAIRDKALSTETLANPLKLKELYDSYKESVITNIGLNEVQEVYNLAQTSNLSDIKSIVLDDRSTEDSGGLLYEPENKTLYEGRYVLIPKAGDYSQIHAHIAKLLFGE